MQYLKLIRPFNLLLLALSFVIFRYGFLKFDNPDAELALSNFQFYLLMAATLLMAAGGYIINAIFDQGTDAINKPNSNPVGKQIEESTAYYLFAGLSITGVGIGMYLSNVIQRPGFIIFFILIVSLLYSYSSSLKQIALLGNLVIALLSGFSVLIIGIFDLFPATDDANRRNMTILFSVLYNYALFAFVVTLIREIIKDAEDLEGDYAEGITTFPVRFGLQKTNLLVAVLTFFTILFIGYYSYINFFDNNLNLTFIYVLLLIIAPLIFVGINVLKAKETKEYRLLSTILKIVIFFGILSIYIVNVNKSMHG
jgi:4-hydroxybenzoate polyprenyltransferase